MTATVFIDADNTLWDTDAVFAKAQLRVLRFIEEETGSVYAGDDPLAFIREVDQALAKSHHSGLRYPPRLLAQGVALALTGLAPGSAARVALKGADRHSALPDGSAVAAEQAFLSAVSVLPELRPGVGEGLGALHDARCRVMVITEGARARISRTATAHGINRFIDRIVEAPKWSDLYRRVLRLTGMPDRAFMIGDQLDRDILPAKAAGLETIYFPGNFNPQWQLSEGSVRPDHRILSFVEVPDIVLAGNASVRIGSSN